MKTDEARIGLIGGVGVPVILLLLLTGVYGAQTGGVLLHIGRRLSQLVTGTVGWSGISGGFIINVLVSLCAMVIAMVLGVLLGVGLLSRRPVLRLFCVAVMNLLRNSPWLVVLYAMLYLLPFHAEIFGFDIGFPPFAKAVAGLSLPVLANMAEIFRGAAGGLPSGQWQAARSLGYQHGQILIDIVIPQIIPRMIPNVMNLYAMLMIGTSLIVVAGAGDVLSAANVILATDGSGFATAMYLTILFLFFAYCFPIAIASRWLERGMGERRR